MVTNTPGDQARLFGWQMSHYMVRGGPNDPVQPSVSNLGGLLTAANIAVFPPVPGAQPASPQIQPFYSTTGAGTATITTNNGGIRIGTIPFGAWIENVELYCYTALAGGTGTTTSVGLYYAVADTAYPPATLTELAYITTPGATTLYSTRGTNGGATAFTGVANMGPVAAATGDIDIYAVNWLIAGGGVGLYTAGNFSVMIEFTGLEG